LIPFELFRRAAHRYPDNVALIHDGGSLTYRELAHRVLQLAKLLVTIDPQAQSRVAIASKNSVEHVVGILAVLASHKTWVPINPRNGDNEIKRGIEITEPSIALFDDEMNSRVTSGVKHQLLLEDSTPDSVMKQAAEVGPLEEIMGYPDLTGVQAIKFTGGTSGAPKGSMQSYRCWNAKIVNQLYAFNFNENDRFLATTPWRVFFNSTARPQLFV
jgi:fatty-acyl-CoA synthase